MMRRMPMLQPVRLLLLLPALLALALPALALFKVVAPDGSITYTDRAPTGTAARVTSFGREDAPATAPEAALPPELRQPVGRYPVTLYTAADCQPCAAARQLLQGRGVPYAERSVSSSEDVEALERLVGGRSVPSLTIGAQPLRGLAQADWNNYLDAAGYPRESRLPRNWVQTPATPLVRRVPVVRGSEADPAAAPFVSQPLPVDPAPNAIRF